MMQLGELAFVKVSTTYLRPNKGVLSIDDRLKVTNEEVCLVVAIDNFVQPNFGSDVFVVASNGAVGWIWGYLLSLDIERYVFLEPKS